MVSSARIGKLRNILRRRLPRKVKQSLACLSAEIPGFLGCSVVLSISYSALGLSRAGVVLCAVPVCGGTSMALRVAVGLNPLRR